MRRTKSLASSDPVRQALAARCPRIENTSPYRAILTSDAQMQAGNPGTRFCLVSESLSSPQEDMCLNFRYAGKPPLQTASRKVSSSLLGKSKLPTPLFREQVRCVGEGLRRVEDACIAVQYTELDRSLVPHPPTPQIWEKTLIAHRVADGHHASPLPRQLELAGSFCQSK